MNISGDSTRTDLQSSTRFNLCFKGSAKKFSTKLNLLAHTVSIPTDDESTFYIDFWETENSDILRFINSHLDTDLLFDLDLYFTDSFKNKTCTFEMKDVGLRKYYIEPVSSDLQSNVILVYRLEFYVEKLKRKINKNRLKK